MYLPKIVANSQISEKSYRRALQLLSIIKKNPLSFGKDPKALAVAVLYAACVKEGEKISQTRLASAGDISLVTLRKRFEDIRVFVK